VAGDGAETLVGEYHLLIESVHLDTGTCEIKRIRASEFGANETVKAHNPQVMGLKIGCVSESWVSG